MGAKQPTNETTHGRNDPVPGVSMDRLSLIFRRFVIPSKGSYRIVEIPQTTTNHRKPPQTTLYIYIYIYIYIYMITVERGGNGCGIATKRALLAFKYAIVGMEGSGKCYRRTRLKV